jgi:hypothetical protein
MRPHLTMLVLFVVAVRAGAQDDRAVADDIQTILKQGAGTPHGRAAWERLSERPPAVLLDLLQAMNSADTSRANWLRTAFDRIVERERQRGGKNIPVDALLRFAQTDKHSGRARRLALDLVEELRPGTGAKLHAGWLDDPEFRYEAVAGLIAKAQQALKARSKDDAAARFRQALAASRDVTQARAAAAGLEQLGAKVSVAEHLGFLMDWYLIGPFDGGGQKGFTLSYPPETKVDLAGELAGQHGKKLRWVRYRALEPAHASGARHQALVNLREKEALGDADDALAYAYSEFTVPAALAAELRGAADDNFTVWVNGQRVFGFEEWRNGVRHDRHRFAVSLRAGKNAVLVKICQTPAPNVEPNWEFFLRVVDATGKGVAMKNALP